MQFRAVMIVLLLALVASCAMATQEMEQYLAKKLQRFGKQKKNKMKAMQRLWRALQDDKIVTKRGTKHTADELLKKVTDELIKLFSPATEADRAIDWYAALWKHYYVESDKIVCIRDPEENYICLWKKNNCTI